ncbi:MAG: hypothetical protein PHV34_08805 [Verrucomicrobiae bacterium]|nr:hypothetical protein [Verrucomicrobiae bacterium]
MASANRNRKAAPPHVLLEQGQVAVINLINLGRWALYRRGKRKTARTVWCNGERIAAQLAVSLVEGCPFMGLALPRKITLPLLIATANFSEDADDNESVARTKECVRAATRGLGIRGKQGRRVLDTIKVRGLRMGDSENPWWIHSMLRGVEDGDLAEPVRWAKEKTTRAKTKDPETGIVKAASWAEISRYMERINPEVLIVDTLSLLRRMTDGPEFVTKAETRRALRKLDQAIAPDFTNRGTAQLSRATVIFHHLSMEKSRYMPIIKGEDREWRGGYQAIREDGGTVIDHVITAISSERDDDSFLVLYERKHSEEVPPKLGTEGREWVRPKRSPKPSERRRRGEPAGCGLESFIMRYNPSTRCFEFDPSADVEEWCREELTRAKRSAATPEQVAEIIAASKSQRMKRAELRDRLERKFNIAPRTAYDAITRALEVGAIRVGADGLLEVGGRAVRMVIRDEEFPGSSPATPRQRVRRRKERGVRHHRYRGRELAELVRRALHASHFRGPSNECGYRRERVLIKSAHRNRPKVTVSRWALDRSRVKKIIGYFEIAPDTFEMIALPVERLTRGDYWRASDGRGVEIPKGVFKRKGKTIRRKWAVPQFP